LTISKSDIHYCIAIHVDGEAGYEYENISEAETISDMIEEQIPLKVVSYTLGHANISTTADRYCNVIQGHKEAAAKVAYCFFNPEL